jgi:Zn-dependent peptidase ImmA (M78 family)
VVKFNPARLSIARKRRLLNKQKLADLLRVELRTIVRWEMSQADPTAENLDAIAIVLKFPKAFFFGPDIDCPVCEHTSFRSQTSMTAAEREASLAAGQIGFLVSDWIAERFDLPQANLPDLHLFDPESAAKMLRCEWGMGEKPISNMIHLLESKGVRVFSLAENTAHVNAYSLWRKEVPYIFLNTFKSAECSRFDAAHELAHLVLHQDGGMKGREAEEQANLFASAFLMPPSDVLASLPRVRDLKHLIGAKKRWRVSLAALAYRVHKMGVVSDWRNRDFCIAIAKNGFNKSEPEPIEREGSVVLEKVIKALWAEKTTPHDVAEELHIPDSELSGLFGVLNGSQQSKPSGSELMLVEEAEGIKEA